MGELPGPISRSASLRLWNSGQNFWGGRGETHVAGSVSLAQCLLDVSSVVPAAGRRSRFPPPTPASRQGSKAKVGALTSNLSCPLQVSFEASEAKPPHP